LEYGSLPGIYGSDDPRDDLLAYCGTYLQQEIAEEGLIRRIDAFARFLKTAAVMNAFSSAQSATRHPAVRASR